MILHNTEIAALFNKLADLLEIENANPFRIRAYRNAARSILNLSKELTSLVNEDYDLTEIPNIGDAIAEKIHEIINTGKLPALEEEQKHVPAVLSTLMEIEGLGPKRVKQLYEQLKIKSTQDLLSAINSGKVSQLPRFGEKITTKIKACIEHFTEYERHIRLADAMPHAKTILAYLEKIPEIIKAEIAGSFRRRKEVIGDLDVLVTAKESNNVIDQFTQFDFVHEIISKGPTRASVRINAGIQVDLRLVPPISYGSAQLYFTGSKAHNIQLRRMALKKGLKINEYGILRKDVLIASKTETDMYNAIGLPYIPPELREDHGEIAAALAHKLPNLVELKQIRGDLHSHTNATEGMNSLEEMAAEAKKLGYEYLAITDHSKHLAVTHGLDAKQLLKQIKAIDKLNAKLSGITLLKSCEVDILENGSLDLSDSILKELDLTVCSVHSKFNLSNRKQTERIIHAMDNPYFNILAHPNGRLLNKREAYDVDMEKIMHAAKTRGCILEVNAQPQRLDINEIYCKQAKEMNLLLVVSSDAHSIEQLSYMQYGVFQARRGWLEAKDLLNTRKLAEMKKLLRRK